MNIVIIESPFSGNEEENKAYVRDAMLDCLMRGEAPYASHALYTQPGVLDDSVAKQRDLGIQAGFAFREVANLTVVYTDLGITPGMQLGIANSFEKKVPVVYRQLKKWGARKINE